MLQLPSETITQYTRRTLHRLHLHSVDNWFSGDSTCFRTPWTWVRRTNCGTSCDVMAVMAAASCAAREYGICHLTLHTVCVMTWKKKRKGTTQRVYERRCWSLLCPFNSISEKPCHYSMQFNANRNGWHKQVAGLPEKKSLSMHTSFRGNLSRKDLPRELYENKLETRNGYNVDETGVYTVQVLIKLLLQNERTK